MNNDPAYRLVSNFFKELDQLGVGSEADTVKAIRMIKGLPINAKIADIGCGTGSQTMTLAKNLTGTIHAIDALPDFIDNLNKKIIQNGYGDRIKTSITQSMNQLPIEEGELDLIWAEGSIYNIGFENGLSNWRKYLKVGGYIAISELSWITNTRPRNLEYFWQNKYPEINTIANKKSILELLGYKVINYHVLPDSAWGNYHEPFKKRITSFLDEEQKSNSAKILISNLADEIDFYERYKEYYSYVFYIAQKT